MSLTIDVYCNDGSPIGIVPPDIYTRGVGGAELSLMTWAEVMASRGHSVQIYNDPKFPGVYDGVRYLPRHGFMPKSDHRDVLIAWRSPFHLLKESEAGIKIHWSTDQQTVGDFARDILPYVDKVVTISPFHTHYYSRRYNPHRTFPMESIHHIDLGVREQDYASNMGEKQRELMLWSSVPDRGLDLLLRVWGEIKKNVPESRLVITSDYTLWGGRAVGKRIHAAKWARYSDSVTYLGAIPRRELVELQQKAGFSLGSFTYDELFCIVSAEAQYTGAVSITSDKGALPTTNKGGVVLRIGEVLRSLPTTISDIYHNAQEMDEISVTSRLYAKQRFNWQYIAQKWEYLFATGKFD